MPALILLDTHVLVWSRSQSKRLSKHALSAIRRAAGSHGSAVSAATLWELAQMGAQGKLGGGTLRQMIEDLTADIAVLPLTAEIVAQAAQFGGDYPRDPSDRLIGATAVVHGLTLVTADERLRAFPLLRTLW